MFSFNNIAQTYDDFYKDERGRKVDEIEKKCVSKLLKKIPPGKALEIGAGTGHWTQFFTQNNFYVTGIDIATGMMDVAMSKNIKNAVFKQADVLNLPFADETFDAVFAVTVLEFVHDWDKALSEIKRVLKKNAYFLLAGLTNSQYNIIKKYKSETFKDAVFVDVTIPKKLLSIFGSCEFLSCLQFEKDELTEKQDFTKNKLDNKNSFAVFLSKKI